MSTGRVTIPRICLEMWDKVSRSGIKWRVDVGKL